MLCEAWSWRQANGALCDGVCRGLLLALDRAGHIRLPPPQSRRAPRWRPPRPVEVQPVPREGSLGDLGPIEIQQVRRTPEEALVDWLIAEHHYLGFAKPVGEHLKYLVTAGGSPLACFGWSSAPRHLGPRDRHIGWSAEARQANLRYIAYQSRFLILPWVKVPHLASHLAGPDGAAALGRLGQALRASNHRKLDPARLLAPGRNLSGGAGEDAEEPEGSRKRSIGGESPSEERVNRRLWRRGIPWLPHE